MFHILDHTTTLALELASKEESFISLLLILHCFSAIFAKLFHHYK